MTPSDTARALDLVAGAESFVDHAYYDCCGRAMLTPQCGCRPRGVLTIAYGFNLEDGTLSVEIGRALLREQWEAKRALCQRRIPGFDDQPPARQAGLVECAYQGPLFRSPRALAAMARGDWIEAERELLDGPWVQISERRARRVAGMIGSGEWPA